MLTLRSFGLVLLTLNLAALLIFITTSGLMQKNETFTQETIESRKFNNKELALDVLKQLEDFKPVPLEYYNTSKSNARKMGLVYLGIKPDPDYCDKVRELLVDDPEIYFNELNYLTDDVPDTLMRNTLIPKVGKDLMPQTTYAKIPKANSTKPRWFMDPRATIYSFSVNLHHHHELGKEIGCLFQMYNHVAGNFALYRKDSIATAATNYMYKYQSKPHCFDGTKFFPRTLSLDNETECLQWFDYIKSEEYKAEKAEKTIVFIRKISVASHQGKGVQPVDEDEERNLTEQYGGGSLCGKNDNPVIVQRYIHNPLLVEGHKFDFRIYMLIASVNPLVVYYHDGFLRVSFYEYDVTNKEKGMHLTNTAQSAIAMKKAIKEGMNETELQSLQMWNLTRFTDYLVRIGKVKSRDWLDEYLRPQFQQAMQHLVRMTQHRFYQYSSSSELMGVDFMLDEDLNLWFIEANIGPELKGTPKEKEILVTRMIYDMLEILTSQLKSRLKRAIKYINWLEQTGLIKLEEGGKVVISKLWQRRKEFADLTKNHLDEEFELSSDNTWVKIIDENLNGLDRYNGMISIDCF